MGLRSSIWFYSAATDAVLFDQVTKYLARQFLSPGEPVVLIPGLLDLNLTYNTGAAFGILPDWAPLFIIVALVAIFAIVKLRRFGGGSAWVSVGLGMLLGGAVGNLIDRIGFAKRGVTDFIDIHISSFAWPTFNVADVAIVIGAILVISHVYILERRREDDRHEEAAD